MDASFEEQKRKLLHELSIAYTPKERPWWKTKYVEYISTESLANTPPYLTAADAKTTFRRNAISDFAIVLFLIIWVSFVIFSFNWLRVILGGFGIFVLVKALKNLFDREIKLKIDKEGIWDNIVATVIQEKWNGRSRLNDLNVHYYNRSINCFESKIIDLDQFGMRFEKIAFSIEYYKMIYFQS